MRMLILSLFVLVGVACNSKEPAPAEATTPSETKTEPQESNNDNTGALSKIEQERSANWPNPSSQQGINWRAFKSGSLERLNLHCVLFTTIDKPSNGHVYLAMTPCGGSDDDTPEVTVDAGSDLAKSFADRHAHIATVSLIHHADYFHIDRVYAIGHWTPLPDPPTPP